MESYKWLYNILILNLYKVCLDTKSNSLSNPENLQGVTESEGIEDLKSLEQELYSMLDPSIRHYIQKRGISLRENTYIGFDTEFTKKELLTVSYWHPNLSKLTKVRPNQQEFS